jgi:hypothetical protein
VQAGRGGGHLFAKPAIGLDTAAIEQMFFVLGDEACYVLLSRDPGADLHGWRAESVGRAEYGCRC